ncbi:acid protease [Mycena maculata]|uniref:Acid protease n=1 Tax=Mycena maculata TaxID=230809 RepID=A0AAD7IVL1_9AGAR|nr:acid protease [Mycena maculata]
MFTKSSVLLFYLILTAGAVPHLGAPPIEGLSGISIPLRKRSTFTGADGVFDKNAAIAATIATQNKHRQNLINLQNNKGASFFNPGAAILPLATLPVDILGDLKKKRQAEPLTDENDDVEWAGSIAIGTPAQNFVIDFDNLWVPSASCSSSTCASKAKFNPNSSTTAVHRPGTFSIEYGDGSTVSGAVYTDTVTVAGVKATNQAFSTVTTLSTSFAQNPADGILGMAYPSISNLGENPFFTTAHSEGAVRKNSFGFFLAANGSELYLGGTNEKLYSGNIEYHTINSTSGFWQIPGASVKVNSTAALTGFQTVIDSGTTIMYGPLAAVQTLYSNIPGSAPVESVNGFYSFPCASAPKVAFSWGEGLDWEITAANLNLGLLAAGSSDCVGAISGEDLGLGSDVWLLGDSFMKNVYTAFDFNQSAVGFAALI